MYTMALATFALLADAARAETVSPVQKQESGEVSGVERRMDDVWLISTRCLCCPCWHKADWVELEYQRYDHPAGWSEATLEEFLAGETTRRTLIYLHGNRVSAREAFARGWQAYHALLDSSDAEPVRFVIWSWPSDQICGPLRDVRSKAARTNGEGHYLAWLLAQLPSETPVSLLGYSFGARVATGALHVLGGGELAGSQLPPSLQRSTSATRVVLMAAALHNWWLQPGGSHEQALGQMEQLLIQYNSCDPVLQRYRFVEKRSKPAALGYTGMYLDEDVAISIDQSNVCCLVGRSHDEDRYLNSPSIVEEARQALLGP